MGAGAGWRWVSGASVGAGAGWRWVSGVGRPSLSGGRTDGAGRSPQSLPESVQVRNSVLPLRCAGTPG